jgi:hypothetical protein
VLTKLTHLSRISLVPSGSTAVMATMAATVGMSLLSPKGWNPRSRRPILMPSRGCPPGMWVEPPDLCVTFCPTIFIPELKCDFWMIGVVPWLLQSFAGLATCQTSPSHQTSMMPLTMGVGDPTEVPLSSLPPTVINPEEWMQGETRGRHRRRADVEDASAGRRWHMSHHERCQRRMCWHRR